MLVFSLTTTHDLHQLKKALFPRRELAALGGNSQNN